MSEIKTENKRSSEQSESKTAGVSNPEFQLVRRAVLGGSVIALAAAVVGGEMSHFRRDAKFGSDPESVRTWIASERPGTQIPQGIVKIDREKLLALAGQDEVLADALTHLKWVEGGRHSLRPDSVREISGSVAGAAMSQVFKSKAGAE